MQLCVFAALVLLTSRASAQAVYYSNYAYDEDPAPDNVLPVVLTCDYKHPDSEWTWDDLQNDIDGEDEVSVEIPCTVEIEGQIKNNVMVKQRGESSRRKEIKSYTIKFGKENERWRGLDRLMLKKDPADDTGIRGKLAFDAFKEVPYWASFRTSFHTLKVNLVGRDGGEDVETLDFGFYTNYEKGDEDWIERRGLQGVGHAGKDAWLYKLNGWDFSRKDAIRVKSDPGYNKDDFEQFIEMESNTDHSKVVKMMNDINDASDADFREVLLEHFNLDNLATFVAVYVVCGDWDHTSRNMYIFSSANNKHWYIYPWDFDRCMGYTRSRQGPHVSLTTSSDNYLFRRIMMNLPVEFTALVDNKVQELTQTAFSRDGFLDVAEMYGEIASPYFGPESPDYTLLDKLPWEESKVLFLQSFEANPQLWEKNKYLPVGIRMVKLEKEDDGDYDLQFRSALSPTGQELRHKWIIAKGFPFRNEGSRSYIRWPTEDDVEKIVCESEWETMESKWHYQKFPFKPCDEAYDECGDEGAADGCYLYVTAIDEDGRQGPWSMDPIPVPL